MEIDGSIFSVKLHEMEEQYAKIHRQICVCEDAGQEQLWKVLQETQDEYKEKTLRMEQELQFSRSKAVQKLAGAQLDYRKKTENILKDLSGDIHCETNTPEEDEAEACLLYAEYAMDFATISMQQALMAALSALYRYKKQ